MSLFWKIVLGWLALSVLVTLVFVVIAIRAGAERDAHSGRGTGGD